MDPTRRVALICSHLRPVAASVPTLTRSSTSNSPPRSSSDVSKDSNSNTDCVFCRVINGDSPAFKLYEDDQCLCILDSNPLAPGHCLIIPKFHYSSLEATPPSVVAAMCSKVPFIGSAIMRATACDSFNLLVNNGAAAGQVIFHTHIHIIPRKKSDCLWTSESLCRKPMFGTEASQLAERVREEMTGSNYVSEEGKVQVSSSLS